MNDRSRQKNPGAGADTGHQGTEPNSTNNVATNSGKSNKYQPGSKKSQPKQEEEVSPEVVEKQIHQNGNAPPGTGEGDGIGVIRQLLSGADDDVDPRLAGQYEDLAEEMKRVYTRKERLKLLREAAETQDDPALKELLSEQDGSPLPAIEIASKWLQEKFQAPDMILDGVSDLGAKMGIIGDSKAKKTFFCLQLGVFLASAPGPFLGWRIPKPRKTLIVQLEVTKIHYHRRLWEMANAVNVSGQQLDNLGVMNARGYEQVLLDELEASIKENGYEVVIIDPLYKVLEGDENLARDVKPTLQKFDRICEKTGAALVFAHHNPKGTAGDRKAIDRGAGSSVISRDFDAALYLGDHKEEHLFVVEPVLRNYPPQDGFSIRWDRGCFHTDPTPPIVKNSKNSQNEPDVTPDHVDQVLQNGPLPTTEIKNQLHQFGTKRSAEALVSKMLSDGRLDKVKEPGQTGAYLVGTPSQIQEKRKEFGKS